MYQPHEYAAMIADRGRWEPYLAAIAATVHPGDVVVELGTGYGHMAIAACKAGARRVYAIDVDGDAIEFANELVAANGCADRVTLVHGHSTRLDVQERAGVVIEDVRGVLPFFGDRVQSLVDARARLLLPDARAVAVRDVVFATPTERPAEIGRIFSPPEQAVPAVDGSLLNRRLRDNWYRVNVEPSSLLADPAELLSIDLAAVTSPDAHGSAGWTIARNGLIDGIVLWFHAELAGGAVVRTGPALREGDPAHARVYGQAFFPLTEPVRARAGDRIEFEFSAKFFPGRYVYSWATTHRSGPGAGPATTFRQSSLGATVGSLGNIARRQPTYRPAPGRITSVSALALGLADGSRSYSDIADALMAQRPGEFRDRGEALDFVIARIAPLEDEDSRRRDGHS